jgi:hypothetical protein
MRVLVILFGGVDYEYVVEFDCRNLKQAQFGRLEVDELWKDRDVATQITSQFITGKTWRESGVLGRKRYINENTERLEKRFIRTRFQDHPWLGPLEYKTRILREGYYAVSRKHSPRKRNYLKDDLRCETLFDLVPNSKAVYVPSYNPEPSWALDRNILDPRYYPSLGEEGALDLAEKNFNWRRKRLFDEVDRDYQLLVAQFQILDSLQHLYLVYSDEPRMDKIEEIYRRMDAFAAEIKEAFDQYDRVVFLSDNGAATTEPGRTHHNRPFYSISDACDLDGVNMRDFFGHVLEWTREDQSEMVGEEGPTATAAGVDGEGVEDDADTDTATLSR